MLGLVLNWRAQVGLTCRVCGSQDWVIATGAGGRATCRATSAAAGDSRAMKAGSSPPIFVLAHSRARFSGQCVQFWPRMVCRSHTTWLGSHVACVAGARFQASSAKLVWDIMACGAAGVSAARGRARGVAGWSAGGECARGGSRMCVARTEEVFSIATF